MVCNWNSCLCLELVSPLLVLTRRLEVAANEEEVEKEEEVKDEEEEEEKKVEEVTMETSNCWSTVCWRGNNKLGGTLMTRTNH